MRKEPFDYIGYAIAKEKRFRSNTQSIFLVIYLVCFVMIGIKFSWWLSVGITFMLLSWQVIIMQSYIFHMRYPKPEKSKDKEEITGKPSK